MRLLFERRWDENRYVCLKSITEIIKNFKSLYGFGGRCLKIRDLCMDFEPYFKVHNLVSVHPKSIILGQMIKLDMIFHVVVSVHRFVKIWNSPQFPVKFRSCLWYKGNTQTSNGGQWSFRFCYWNGRFLIFLVLSVSQGKLRTRTCWNVFLGIYCTKSWLQKI